MWVRGNSCQARRGIAVVLMFACGAASAQAPLSPDEWFELISNKGRRPASPDIPAQSLKPPAPLTEKAVSPQGFEQARPSQSPERPDQTGDQPASAESSANGEASSPAPTHRASTVSKSQESSAADLSPQAAPTAQQSPARKNPVAPATGQGYADQYLIDEWPEEYQIQQTELAARIQPAGRRSLSGEWLTTQQRNSGRAANYDTAARLHYNRETLNYGQLSLQASLAYVLEAETAPGQQVQDSAKPAGRYLALVDGFPVTPHWHLDASGGVQPALNHPLATTGYRVNLPSSLIDGYTASLSNGRQTLGYSNGRLGQLGGFAGLEFRPSRSSNQGISYEAQLGSSWTLAAQATELQGDERISDHQSAAAALRYAAQDQRSGFSLHGLYSDTGSIGYWLDGKAASTYWKHRFGGLFLEDGLLWNATHLADNRVGAYWQADRRTFVQNLSSSFGYDETNHSGAPGQTGSRLYSAALNLSRKLSYTLRAGASLSINRRLPGRGLSEGHATSSRINSFVSPQWDLGVSQLQASWSRLRRNAQDTDQWGLSWDHAWATPPDLALSTSLAVSKSIESNGDELRYSGGLSLRYVFDGGTKLDLSYNYGQVQQADLNGPQSAASNSGNLGLSWKALGGVEWQLQAFINQSETNRSGISSGARVDSQIQLSARHQLSSGRPFSALGFRTAAGGNGTLRGKVYFDANANGRHDANEKVARGLLVYLDGRFISQTDSNGYYSFDPVHAGRHRVSIAIEDVPLPWILEDEEPRLVHIGVRESTPLDFPLVAPNF